MSVCVFGAAELANVAGMICNAPQDFRPNNLVQLVCDNLALISQANVACFNDKYRLAGGEASMPATRAEIAKAMRPGSGGRFHVSIREAISCVSLMHYNCDDEGGDFTLKIEGAHAALIYVLKTMMLMALAAGKV